MPAGVFYLFLSFLAHLAPLCGHPFFPFPVRAGPLVRGCQTSFLDRLEPVLQAAQPALRKRKGRYTVKCVSPARVPIGLCLVHLVTSEPFHPPLRRAMPPRGIRIAPSCRTRRIKNPPTGTVGPGGDAVKIHPPDDAGWPSDNVQVERRELRNSRASLVAPSNVIAGFIGGTPLANGFGCEGFWALHAARPHGAAPIKTEQAANQRATANSEKLNRALPIGPPFGRSPHILMEADHRGDETLARGSTRLNVHSSEPPFTFALTVRRSRLSRRAVSS